METETVYGITAPRVFTAPLRLLTRRSTLGYEVIDFAEKELGWNPLPWQRWWLLHALELLPDGSMRYKKALLLVSRQQGKSELVSILALWKLSKTRSVLYSSATLDTAKEQFEMTGDRAEEADPKIFGKVVLRRSTGQWAIELPNRRVKYKIVSSNRRGGRGLTKVGLILVDELREHETFDALAAIESTTLAVSDAMIVMLSNAGDRKSVVLNHWQAVAEAEADPELFYASWSAPANSDITDIDAIRQANPALGRTVTLRSLLALAQGPVAIFKTENMCMSVPSLSAAVDPASWELCLDPLPIKDKARVALGIDISPDLRHCTVVAASTGSDGRTRVETVGVYESPAEVRQELPELIARIKPRSVGWYPSGPASALAADLKLIKRNEEITGQALTSACMSLAEQISSGRIAHNGDEMLTAQILGASRLRVGDSWKFGRQGESPVDGAYATAAAVALARRFRPGGSFAMVTAQTTDVSSEEPQPVGAA